MHYEDRIVCFLDILGFADHVRATIRQNGSEDEDSIKDIASAFEIIRYLLDIDKPEERKGREVTQFSDSVVISFPINEESVVFYALLEILWVQLNLVLFGMLCRGAVSKGKLIHTEKMLYGPALIDAYRLESKAALYPRVILDESIVEVGISAHAQHHLEEHERESIMGLLHRDSDGMYYIDYITRAQSELDDPEWDYPDYLRKLGTMISDGLRSHDPSIRIKYLWMKERFAPHLTHIKSWVHETELDNALRENYKAIPDI